MASLYDELMIALNRVWDRKWLALVVAWIVCVLGWLGISFIPSAYESHARVFVQTQSVLQGKMGITPLEQQANLDSIRQTLNSTENLEKVVRGTDLIKYAPTPADVNGRINMLRTKITVLAQANNLFDITARMSDSTLPDRVNAQISAQIVNKLLEIFRNENSGADDDETRQGVAFLDRQINETGAKLQEAEQARAQFSSKYQNALPGIGPIEQRVAAAQAQLSQIDSQLIAAQSAASALNAQLAGTPPTLNTSGTPGGNPALAAAMNELAQAKARGWTDSHPDVIGIKRQIAIARSAGSVGGTPGTSTPNPAYQSIRSMQAERQGAVQALMMQKSQLQAQIATMQAPGVASEQNSVEQQYQALKAQYDKLVANRQDVQLRNAVQTDTGGSSFRVIDPPSVPNAPISPNRPLLFIGILIAGLFIGGGVAFVVSQLNNGFATIVALERAAGIPVIGSISETPSGLQLAQARASTRKFFMGTGGLVAACLVLIVIEFAQRTMA